MRKFFIALTLLMLSLSARADGHNFFFISLDELSPGEQFRQLSLMLMVTDGADEDLIEELTGMLGEKGSVEQDGSRFSFDDYTTPLIRIVDQQTMLAGATQVFVFTREHQSGIAARLKRLLDQEGEALAATPMGSISEDAIIIRNAIADSIDYMALQEGRDAEDVPLSGFYRSRTTFLRNNLEYELFAADLDRITNEAIASVGGRTEAYERMFDDEVDSDAIDKKIRAAEYAYGWDPDFDERAAKMAQELLETIEETESTPDTP